MSFLWHGLTEQGAQVPVQVDAQGRVIAVDGTPGVSNWERTGTTLSPAVSGDGVTIDGETRVGEQLNIKGGRTNTVVIYDGTLGAGHDIAVFKNDGSLFIGGSGLANTPATSPNITLNASGSAKFSNNVSVGVAGASSGSFGNGNGVQLWDYGFVITNRTSETSLALGRNTTEGDIVSFNYGTTEVNPGKVGSIAVKSTGIEWLSANSKIFADGSASFSKPVQNSAGNGVYIGPNTEAGNISIYSDDASASNGDHDTAFLLGFSGGSAKTLKFQVGHDGSASFAGNVELGKGVNAGADTGVKLFSEGVIQVSRTGAQTALQVYSSGNTTPVINLSTSGNASFTGDITAANVTFRSADPQFYVKKSKNKDAQPEYVGPELDLLAEIARLEALVRHLYETLRITPPAGWPVWDGNDDVLRQLRK